MDLQSLIAKMDAIEAGQTINEATAPTQFVPTHFHKSNLGTTLPLMQTPDGNFWWEGGQQGGEYNPGASGIVPWQGNTLNRSGWNPASVDGVIKDGKQIEFPEGVNWQQYAEKEKASNALLEKLKLLTDLIKKYLELKAKKATGTQGQGAKPTLTPKTTVAPVDKATNDAMRNKLQAAGVSADQIAKILAQSPLTGQTAQPTYKDEPGSLKVYKEGNDLSISSALMESFGYEAPVDENTATAAMGATGKALGKGLTKAAPGLGLAVGAYDAYDRAKKGDWLGAGIAGLSGAVSLIPGVGWIPALGLDMINVGRDLRKGDAGGEEGSAKPTGGSDAKLAQLQKIIGAKPDGIMGPETKQKLQTWQQQQGITADGLPGPETYGKAGIKESVQMKSLAESMKDLQNRLAMIENEVAVDEPTFEEAEAQPASGEENQLAQQLAQVGGQLVKKDERTFMILPDGKTVVDTATMDIVDGSSPNLTPTGKQFNPAEFGLSEDQVSEGIWSSIIKGASKLGTGAKMAAKNFAGGMKGAVGAAAPTGKMLGKTGSAATQMQKVMPGSKAAFAAGKGVAAAGKTMAKHPVGTALAGLGAGYMLGGDGKPVPAGGTAGGSTSGGSARPTPGGAGDSTGADATAQQDDEMNKLLDQINALVAELAKSGDPAVQKGLQDLKPQLDQIAKK